MWLAGRLNCGRNNIYNISNRKSVDPDLLIRISRILQHDFFQDISCCMAAERQGPADENEC